MNATWEYFCAGVSLLWSDLLRYEWPRCVVAALCTFAFMCMLPAAVLCGSVREWRAGLRNCLPG
jgi:hypothetical protein